MMKNPFGPPVDDQGLYSYVNLQKRVLKSLQEKRIYDQIFSTVKKTFEESLRKENVQLTSIEKKRMLTQVMKQVLTGMLSKLEDSSKS